MGNIVNIDSLSSYVEQVCDLSKPYRKSFPPAELLFRGHDDNSYEILPSIARDKDFTSKYALFDHERDVIDFARYKFPNIFTNDMKPLEMLALLQHYGIPTRLLDVTENALVALYFACLGKVDENGEPQEDGEVIVFHNEKVSSSEYPLVNAIADTYRLTRGADYELEWFYQAAINQPYFLEEKHISEIVSDKKYFIEALKGFCSKPIFVYAPYHILRQQIQQGRYILFPNAIDDNKFITIIKPIPKDNTIVKQVFTIKKNKKKEILRDLECFGISEATLFADEIDCVLKGIKQKFERYVNS